MWPEVHPRCGNVGSLGLCTIVEVEVTHEDEVVNVAGDTIDELESGNTRLRVAPVKSGGAHSDLLATEINGGKKELGALILGVHLRSVRLVVCSSVDREAREDHETTGRYGTVELGGMVVILEPSLVLEQVDEPRSNLLKGNEVRVLGRDNDVEQSSSALLLISEVTTENVKIQSSQAIRNLGVPVLDCALTRGEAISDSIDVVSKAGALETIRGRGAPTTARVSNTGRAASELCAHLTLVLSQSLALLLTDLSEAGLLATNVLNGRSKLTLTSSQVLLTLVEALKALSKISLGLAELSSMLLHALCTLFKESASLLLVLHSFLNGLLLAVSIVLTREERSLVLGELLLSLLEFLTLVLKSSALLFETLLLSGELVVGRAFGDARLKALEEDSSVMQCLAGLSELGLDDLMLLLFNEEALECLTVLLLLLLEHALEG